MQGLGSAAVSLADTSATATARRTELAPSIDGKNRDAVWQAAPKVNDFTQFTPAAPAGRASRQYVPDQGGVLDQQVELSERDHV